MTGFSPVAVRPLSSQWERFYPPIGINFPSVLYRASTLGINFVVEGRVVIQSILCEVTAGTWRFPVDQGFRFPGTIYSAICGTPDFKIDGYAGIVPQVSDFYTDIDPQADLGEV